MKDLEFASCNKWITPSLLIICVASAETTAKSTAVKKNNNNNSNKNRELLDSLLPAISLVSFAVISDEKKINNNKQTNKQTNKVLENENSTPRNHPFSFKKMVIMKYPYSDFVIMSTFPFPCPSPSISFPVRFWIYISTRRDE